jgi:hypothetical protein
VRPRAGQCVPVWLQIIVVVVCATAMVIAADAADYCGETTKVIASRSSNWPCGPIGSSTRERRECEISTDASAIYST